MQKNFVFLQPFLSLGKGEGQSYNIPLIINKLQDCFMEKSKLRSYIYNAVIILLLIAGIVYVVLQFTLFGHVEYTDNARVCQYIAPQNTRVQGFIREIRFEAYQHVNEGDTLVILEDSEYKLRLAQA